MTPYQEHCKKHGVEENCVWILHGTPTPAERHDGFLEGSHLELIRDDGTPAPLFRRTEGGDTRFVSLDRLEPLREAPSQPREEPAALTPYQEYCRKYGVAEDHTWIVTSATDCDMANGIHPGDMIKLLDDNGTNAPDFRHWDTFDRICVSLAQIEPLREAQPQQEREPAVLTPYQEYCKKHGVSESSIWSLQDASEGARAEGFMEGTCVKLSYDDESYIPEFRIVGGTACRFIRLTRLRPVPVTDLPAESPEESPEETLQRNDQVQRESELMLEEEYNIRNGGLVAEIESRQAKLKAADSEKQELRAELEKLKASENPNSCPQPSNLVFDKPVQWIHVRQPLPDVGCDDTKPTPEKPNEAISDYEAMKFLVLKLTKELMCK